MHNLDTTAHSTAGNLARPHFELQEFAAEQFLSKFQADVQSLNWCLKSALVKHAGIDCWEASSFAFGDYGTEPAERWGWTIVDLHSADGRSASFVVSATETAGPHLYSFETDHGFLENVSLPDDAETIFDFLMRGLLPHLS